jgi:mono/diheme cytochrome c family protein
MPTRKGLVGLGIAAASVMVALTGCTVPSTSGGDATAGAAKFAATCSSCHTAASLRGVSSLVTNNMGSLAPAMAGITLTDQEVADVRAFLLTQ